MSFLPGWTGNIPTGTPVALKFVNQYTFNFASTTSATVTVPAIDLLPASPTKQIVVCVGTEAPTIASVTINGVNAPIIVIDQSLFSTIVAAPYAGAGPFNIVVTINAASTELGGLAVFEVDNAAPVYKSFRSQAATNFSSNALPLRIPARGQALADIVVLTDTLSLTWTDLTERSDADVGAYRLSAASTASAVVSPTDIANSITISGSDSHGITGLSIPPTDIVLSGGIRRVTPVGAVNFTATAASFSSYADMGNFKLVVFVMLEENTTITGMTFNGAAMTLIGSSINTAAATDLLIYAFAIDVTTAAPTGSLVATSSVNINGRPVVFAIHQIYGVGNIGTPQGVTGNGLGNAVNVDVANGGMILGAHIRQGITATVAWTGAIENSDGRPGSTPYVISTAGYPYAAAQTGRTIQPVGSVSEEYATLAIPFNP